MQTRLYSWLLFVGVLVALVMSTSAWSTSPRSVKQPADSATSSRASHEARRAKFQQLCANPTASQRETLEIWARLERKNFGAEFCGDLEFKHFGTKDKPKTWHEIGFSEEAKIRDYSPIQYFGGIKNAGIGGLVTDLTAIANFTELERLSVSNSKQPVDISIVANFKNLKELSLRNTQVVSLAPLAGLGKLEILDLRVEPQVSAPGRKGFEALRQLKSLKDFSMEAAEPLGDQLKDLQNLESLVVYGPIKDVCSLKELKKLTSLYLVKSGIQDISCLRDLKNLAVINLRGNSIKSIADLAPLPMLRNLHIEDTLIEDLSALTGNPNMYILEAEGAPLRWCSPKSVKDIKKGISCLNVDGTEKPWWKRAFGQ